MDLNFRNEENKWVAEFQATSNFNLHIERTGLGSIVVSQRGTDNGEYDTAFIETRYEGQRVFDCDFGALVFPKWIKVISGSEVIKGVVTFSA
jgi:hypothetical protein